MKKRISIYCLILLLVLSYTLCGCSNNVVSEDKEPDIMKIRSICDLATLECFYHNVAKAKKSPGKGIPHAGEKERKFWIQYTGTVKLGIDMSQVKMKIQDKNVELTIPDAKVLEVNVDRSSYSKDSYIIDKDNFWNKNKITAEDTTKAINEAKENMRKTAMENSTLLINAQDRAKKLIENYIEQLGEATGVKYTISWKYIEEGQSENQNNSESTTSSTSN